MKRIITSCLALLCAGVCLWAQIVVSKDAAIGPIKRMNAVNNGPRINNAEQVYTGTTGYVLDDNNTSARDVTVRLDGGRFDDTVRCYITDAFSMYTEYPVALQPDGTLSLSLQPHSFVFIEL